MPWIKKQDPTIDVPAVHDPKRCMNCGHLEEQHNSEVGCLVEGGTKYLFDEEKKAEMRACSCEAFVPVPKEKA